LTPEDEEEMNNEELLRNSHFGVAKHRFVGVVIPITAGRDKSIKLTTLMQPWKGHRELLRKNEDIEEPTFNDIHKIGTVARILRVLENASTECNCNSSREKSV
jgi:ATP-dependent Lon protease